MLRKELRWENQGQPETTVRQRDIQAGISKLSGYSAHADQSELCDWVIHEHPHKPETLEAMANKVFLQHGTDHAREDLAKAIEEKASKHGLTVETALPNDSTAWIDLEAAGPP
jgi:metallo-beta-lactamase family protein